ncbi:MAG: ABC transporter permease [Candidatus Micrarchaeota archaeon]|nr:ABC transporter permease [Candidatus Micrarchaeota archaeon]
MDFGKVWAIAIKDLLEVFSSPSIYGPMLGVPLFFAIVLPFLTFYVAQYGAPQLASKIAAVPVALLGQSATGGLIFMSFFAVSVLGPIFLTMPIFTATVIAADSFAGEKERKTSEALLATPVSTGELLLGKVMASFIPAVLLTLMIFLIYGYTVNTLAIQSFHKGVLPTAPWLMMLLTAPFLAVAAIGLVVLVSSHVKGIKEAQQVSTILVLPILVMPFISILGLANLTVSFFSWVIVVLLIADTLILYIGVKTFRKENIL